MTIKNATEGNWLYNGETFAKSVCTANDGSEWQEVSNEYKESVESASMRAEDEEQKASLQTTLDETKDEFIRAMENYFIINGDGEVKTIAENRKAIRDQIDAIGKVVQTAQGSGSMADPYKVWKVGMSVVSGDWWMTQDGYLWQAKKSGVPASSTDAEYWDIVG